MDKNIIDEAREKAINLYKGGTHCSLAILYSINDLLGNPLAEEKINLVSRLPVGIGYGGCFCGAVSGGVMAIGFIIGKNSSNDYRVKSACEELHTWFKNTCNTSCCNRLNKHMKCRSKEYDEQWANLTGELAGKTMELILKYNFNKNQ
ncbi:MAG: C-GCAxxG-C-C family (seleno)protein [Candidatus Eremiobacterota bacterium]